METTTMETTAMETTALEGMPVVKTETVLLLLLLRAQPVPRPILKLEAMQLDVREVREVLHRMGDLLVNKLAKEAGPEELVASSSPKFALDKLEVGRLRGYLRAAAIIRPGTRM